jgi:hypothetical protein
MGGDREARAVGAGESVEVGGVEYTLRPIGFQHLCDLEREALKAYKRDYLSTFSDNADMLPDGRGTKLVEEEMRKIATWTLEDLPQMLAHDVSRIPLSKKNIDWVRSLFDWEEEITKGEAHALLVQALDMKKTTSREVKKKTGVSPIKGFVRYDSWWSTNSSDGRLGFILSSVNAEHPELTRGDIAKWPLPRIAEAVRIVEGLTSPKMGNT